MVTARKGTLSEWNGEGVDSVVRWMESANSMDERRSVIRGVLEVERKLGVESLAWTNETGGEILEADLGDQIKKVIIFQGGSDNTLIT